MTMWMYGLLAALLLMAAMPMVIKRLIKARLRNYRIVYTQPDASQPEKLTQPVSVAVLGGGIAGLTAAITLARRGFAVQVFESNGYIGGKLGSWKIELEGEQVEVSHGFHAFFPGYFNLNRLLDSLGVRHLFTSINDYVIMGSDGSEVRFAKLWKTPVYNLISLARTGVFKIKDALGAPGRDLYGVFLEYDEASTFSKYDNVSFERFNELAKVSPGLRLAFNTFARAFFADGDRLSLAELIKSFHFYYLSHDLGLIYEMPTSDYEASILKPIRDELTRFGAKIHLSSPVKSLEKTDSGYVVNEQRFDKVVLATDVVGARAIAELSKGLPDHVTKQLGKLRPGQRYAVLRLWVDRDIRQNIPVFVITDRLRVLDAVSVYHRLEKESIAWVKAHGGAVLELHCYAVPEDLEEETLRQLLISELIHFFPELKDVQIRHQNFQVKRDFTAFHVGMYGDRPSTHTGVPGLYCAGDWVKLPFPAMLMEAACASGVCAANGILQECGIREERVESVPLKGLMAGIPQPPGRKILSAGK